MALAWRVRRQMNMRKMKNVDAKELKCAVAFEHVVKIHPGATDFSHLIPSIPAFSPLALLRLHLARLRATSRRAPSPRFVRLLFPRVQCTRLKDPPLHRLLRP